jgi:hypothetical protein
MSARRFPALLAPLALLLTVGCATIVSGGPTALDARSTPAGARVVADGLSNGERLTGTTPTTFTLDKGSDYELTFELQGFESETIVVRREVNGWFFGNFLLGVVPMIVDAATNNVWSHTLRVAEVDFTTAERRPDGTLVADVVVHTVVNEGDPQVARVPVVFRPTGS